VDEDLDAGTAAARQEIEETRAEMSSTIEAIEERLDPEVLSAQAKDTAREVTDYAIQEAKDAAREITEHVVEQAKATVLDISDQAKSAVRDATIGRMENMARNASNAAGGWRHTVTESITANPLPAAMVGLGLGWILLNRPSGSRQQQYTPRQQWPYGSDAYSGAAYGGNAYRSSGDDDDRSLTRVGERAQHTAGQVVGSVQETAGQVVGQAQETGGQVISEVQQQASRAQGFLQDQLEENPWITGAVAVAIGAVVAATVPRTRREDTMFGETRDQVMGSAKEFTDEAMQKVGHVVDQAQAAATEEARQQSLISNGGVSAGH